jgi:hypothetical protein
MSWRGGSGCRCSAVTWEATSGGRTITAVLYHFGITGSAIVLGNQVASLAPYLSFIGNAVGAAVVACAAVAAGFSLARRDRT